MTDDQLQAFYESHRAQFGIPPMARIRELFFPHPPIGVSEDARATAWAVYEQLRNGASIEDLAAEHGADEVSRRAGGDRGFISLVERPQLAEITADMAPGAFSEPVELTTGYSIVQLVDRRDGIAAPFDAVRDAVERALVAEREGDLIADFLTAQTRARGVEILMPEYAAAWPSLAAESPSSNAND